MLLSWIIVFSILGSVGAIAGAALLLLFPQSTRKILLPCLLSYATGTLLGVAFLGATREAVPFILALSAACFIYIAIADLVPILHRQTGLTSTFRQLGLMLADIRTIALFKFVH